MTALQRARDAWPFWLLAAFVVLVFLIGGSSRESLQSLVVLRPAAVLCLGAGLLTLTRADVDYFRPLLAFAGFVVALALLHLLPLPYVVWSALPGHELAVEAGRLAGLGEPWRPLSLTPAQTWNSFFSLSVPLAALVLAIRSGRDRRFQLLPLLIALGLLSGLLGLMQAIGPAQGPLYFYKPTNFGSAVGLFANRNHHAALLATLFPMLAVYACAGVHGREQARVRGWFAICAGVLVVPLILVTGSRAGLVLGLIGLASVPLLYRRPAITGPARRRIRRFDPRYALGAAAVFALGSVAFLTARAPAVARLVSGDGTEEVRFQVWGPIAELVVKYLPFGSGLGTFLETWRIDEPGAMLSTTYLNRAHNDLLEVALTAGLPALALLLVGAVWWARRALAAVRSPEADRDALFGRLGAVLMLMLALASLADYPLRIPSLATLFVIACVWLAAERLRLGVPARPSKAVASASAVG